MVAIHSVLRLRPQRVRETEKRLMATEASIVSLERTHEAPRQPRSTKDDRQQSFQAQHSSELLPSPWLNNLPVALVVANCWSTPIVQHVFQHHHKSHDLQCAERVVCLMLTTMLNMGSSILIPLVVFMRYL